MEVPAAGAPDVTLAVAPQPPVAPPPSAFARLVAGPFWAGLLCTGVGMWMLGVLISLEHAEVIHASGYLAIVMALVALSVGFAVGYRTPIRSYASLLGRLVGEIFWAGTSAAVLLAFLKAAAGERGDREASMILVGAGVAVTSLVVAKLHRARLRTAFEEPGRARRFAVAGTAALAFATTWSMSPALRCRLGSGAACRIAATALDDAAGGERSQWLERGCDSGDAVSCELAAAEYRRGKDVPRDLDRARELFLSACALGDSSACHDVDRMGLEKRCDGYSATACRELADDLARQDRTAAVRLFHKACLLGDDEACRRK